MARTRLSLTKADIQAGVGAELLALCQSVTEDGRLQKQEIVELTLWLRRNRGSDLPAIAHLAETVERIIADGRVTRDEHDELYKAIETVLPPDVRRDAVASRKAVESERKARDREARAAGKALEREIKAQERERDRPVASLNFMVAGVHYEGRAEVISAHVRQGDPAYLARDPANRFSRNAIEVRLANGMQIGFVPEMDARRTARVLDAGNPHVAYVTKVLTGGRAPIPVVQADIHNADAVVDGLIFPNQVPPKRKPKPWWQVW